MVTLKKNRLRFHICLDHFPFKLECSASHVVDVLFAPNVSVLHSYVVFILINVATAVMSRHSVEFIRPSTSLLAPLVSGPAQVRVRL